MKILWGVFAYVVVGYIVYICLAFEDGGVFENDRSLALAIALTWPVYMVKYIIVAILYILNLIYTGVLYAF